MIHDDIHIFFISLDSSCMQSRRPSGCGDGDLLPSPATRYVSSLFESGSDLLLPSDKCLHNYGNFLF